MKTVAERQAQLRRLDNWVLANPRKADLLAVAAAAVIFGLSQLLGRLIEIVARFLS